MTMIWKIVHPQAYPEMLGYLPDFLSEDDSRPAKEQLHSNYPHGGWHPTPGLTIDKNGDLRYPGDPPVKAMAETTLRNETIRVYFHDWVAIIQADGTYEVARMD